MVPIVIPANNCNSMDINVFGKHYNNIWFCYLPILKGWGDFKVIDMYSVYHNLSQKYQGIILRPSCPALVCSDTFYTIEMMFWLIVQPLFTNITYFAFSLLRL